MFLYVIYSIIVHSYLKCTVLHKYVVAYNTFDFLRVTMFVLFCEIVDQLVWCISDTVKIFIYLETQVLEKFSIDPSVFR